MRQKQHYEEEKQKAGLTTGEVAGPDLDAWLTFVVLERHHPGHYNAMPP